MRASAVELAPPARQSGSCVIQRSEPACVEALVAQPCVEAFDMSALHRLAGLDVSQPSIRREMNSGPLFERTFSGLLHS
jgi:hypothetical protein